MTSPEDPEATASVVSRTTAGRDSLQHRTVEVDGRALILEMILRQMTADRQGLDQETIDSHTFMMTLRETEIKNMAQASEGSQTKCMICLEDFVAGQQLRVLPCFHRYHCDCIDHWLAMSRQCCVCKHDVTSLSTPTL
jgi:hypothetical protein